MGLVRKKDDGEAGTRQGVGGTASAGESGAPPPRPDPGQLLLDLPLERKMVEIWILCQMAIYC